MQAILFSVFIASFAEAEKVIPRSNIAMSANVHFTQFSGIFS